MKKLVVLGAGESGTGAAILGQAKDYEVFVSDMGQIKTAYRALLDQHHIEWEDGKHSEERILAADLVIKRPGIPNNAPIPAIIYVSFPKSNLQPAIPGPR